MKSQITAIRVENLKGFTDTRIDLDRDVTFLVGPNNSGKTSLLRLLDLVFTWDFEPEFARVSDALLNELLPARETRNAARRLSIEVRVSDGRRQKKLRCSNGIATLRFSLRLSDRHLRLNLGAPRRGERHEAAAVDLLSDIRKAIRFIHVPAGRSVDSDFFDEALRTRMVSSLVDVLDRPGKGATREERAAADVVSAMESLAKPLGKFWSELLNSLPAGWVREGSAKAAIDRRALARILVEQIRLGISTGAHDYTGVAPAEVGSGLQSLLDLSIRQAIADSSDGDLILGIEEPEVFLHPSAQRRLARTLTERGHTTRYIISTHSPLVLEETRYTQVALMRDHTCHQPRPSDDGQRSAINSALMTGRGAEVFFARSVLLVEGPGDREYFEALRRRLAHMDSVGFVEHCFVLETGGKARFAPWLRLLSSYPGNPIRWVAALDGDAVADMKRAATDAGIAVSPRQQQILSAVSEARSSDRINRAARNSRKLLDLAAHERPLFLVPTDLEHVMCHNLGAATLKRVSTELAAKFSDPDALAIHLGTKHRIPQQAVGSADKAPWIRAFLGQVTPASETDTAVRRILQHLLAGASSNHAARQLMSRFLNT